MDITQFNDRLAEAARAMVEEPGTTPTLDRAVLMATDLVGACDLVGISVANADGIHTPAASSEELRVIDELQYELREGPCYTALRQHDVVITTELASDERWPNWGAQIAREIGVHSSMSFRLFTTGDDMGLMNLYAREANAFDHEDELEGLIVAAHAAVALAAALREDSLHRALTTRRTIGEATGILRERYGLDSEQAFGVLQRVSSTSNTKLYVLAQQLVDTGALPDRSL